LRYLTILAATLAAASPAAGHHSDAGLDMNSLTTIEGVVTEFGWRNPHIYITLDVAAESGQTVEWNIQSGSTITVGRMGWDRNSLAPGDRVTIQTNAATNGRPYGLLKTIVKGDGTRLPTAFDRGSDEPLITVPEPETGATSLAGRWMADPAKLVSYPGGIDGLFRAHLELTDAGLAAQAALDELTNENPEATCIGRPTPGMIVSTNLFPIEIEFFGDTIVKLRSEYFDDERTVYMDGRGHPRDDQRTIAGHSIGYWDGDVLVVETTNFSDHRSPYQMGVPSGAQKRVVERYRLLEGGKRMIVEFTLEDPDYIVGSMVHSRELVYVPHMPMTSFNCDPDVTRRFVPE
jgi:hypothetical protein